MNCAELDVLLCDFVDGTLDPARRKQVEQHLAECQGCAESARDAAAVVDLISRAANVEAPPELVTKILFQMRRTPSQAPDQDSRFSALIRRWLGPVLQPRFAMGMAMAVLSFSMLGRLAGIEVRQLQPSDLTPANLYGAVEDRMHSGYERAVKFYDSLRLVYEIQSRLREWTRQEDGGNGSREDQSLGPAASQTGVQKAAGDLEGKP